MMVDDPRVGVMYVYKQEPYQTVWEKLIALLQSKRFIAAVAAGLMVLFGKEYGLDDELSLAIVAATMAFIVGDSIRPIQELFKSRRFWAFVGSVAAAVAVQFDAIGLSPEMVKEIVITIAAWIVGDSWRVTLTKPKKLAG